MLIRDIPWQTATPHTLALHFHVVAIRVHSNNEGLIDQLSRYFHDIDQRPVDEEECLDIQVIQHEPLDLTEPFTDWAREAGKAGKKDSFVDLDGQARLLRKVKTGMVFYQSLTRLAAIGPALANISQVINFVLTQVMTRLQWQGKLICHAAAVTCRQKSLVLAGFSGKGKSTLMLRLLELPGVAFTSNDRVFVGQGEVHGVAKMPRINPGTVVGNTRLHSLLGPEKLQAFQAMPQHALWTIEEKVDVPVTQLYGPDKRQYSGQLAGLVLINWNPLSKEAARLEQIDLAARPDLLPAIQKSPGPFYQTADGNFLSTPTAPSGRNYLKAFENSPVFELSGGADFTSAAKQIERLMYWNG